MSIAFDWRTCAEFLLTSRAIDLLEESELYPQKKIAYQFSARGHELGQVILGQLLSHPKDAVSGYYRSRPLLLSLGLKIEEAFAGPLGKMGSYSDGRDIGVVCNLPPRKSATVLPMAGDVGSQYTPAAGWAEAIQYHQFVLNDSSYEGAISVVLGGEGSVATNGFWSALTMATTLYLPMLFFIEDNGYAISVPSYKQTPGGNIAANLQSFKNLLIIETDGSNPEEALTSIQAAVEFVRKGQTPALIRLSVPRLSGHSGQDTQAYKTPREKLDEADRDPLPRLKSFLVPATISEVTWAKLSEDVTAKVRQGLDLAQASPDPQPDEVLKHIFFEAGEMSSCGGLPLADKPSSAKARTDSIGPRINMLEGIRRVLESELRLNPRVVVFGEDVGPKGGVHAATLGLQELFGDSRVYDTSLSEEGIIGRAVGMALSGLMPVPEIQFRKYADPATEQLNNCGTIRWRTKNQFSAPMVVRMTGGHTRKVGDPWHSVSGEATFLHQPGWRFVIPSDAEDAVGLLRTALRGSDPTIFFEHRALLDAVEARRPYPGDDFLVPLGKARILETGTKLTLVTWGAMVWRSLEAAKLCGGDIEILDLRTLCPWDKSAVFESVQKTKRCMVVHEDGITCGFGAEIVAQVTEELFFSLDAPPMRIAPPLVPIPYHPDLMQAVVPTVEGIAGAIGRLLEI